MATASNLFGLNNSALNDFHLLGQPQQDTARKVQQAFGESVNARIRNAQRTPAAYTAATMPNMMAEWAGDSALQQAQASAGMINANQQLQHIIDESKHTPHGFYENAAQFMPLLGGLAAASPFLFGSGKDSEFSKGGGLFGMLGRGAEKAWKWVTDQYGEPKLVPAESGEMPPVQGYDFDTAYNSPYFDGNYDRMASLPQPQFNQMDQWGSMDIPMEDYNLAGMFDDIYFA